MKTRNYVAKHMRAANKAAVHIDRKKAEKAGRKPKHRKSWA
jgi:hypothetical protein